MDKQNYSEKNTIKNANLNAQNIRIGDDSHFHISSTTFTISDFSQFMARVESALLRETIPIFDAHLPIVDSFFQNSDKRILIITGIGETGKTHLLRDLILKANSMGWLTYSVEPASSGLTIQAPSDDIPTLLFKDDVDWEKDDFIFSILKSVDSSPNLRLIITAHQSWKDSITDKLTEIKDLPGKVQYIELPKLNTETLLQILRLAANTNRIKREEEIVRLNRSPMLLKSLGETVSKNKKVDFEAISRNTVPKMRRVIDLHTQAILSADQATSFILYLVFNRVYDHELHNFAQYLNVDLTELKNVLEKLRVAGIIRRNYGIWVIIPDVYGDFFLAAELSRQTETSIGTLLSPYLETTPETTTAKLTEAARYMASTERGILANFLKQTLREWEANSEKFDPAHIGAAREVLKLEKRHQITNATDAACSFVMTALYQQAQSEDKVLAISDPVFGAFTNEPSGVTYGRFLEELVHLHRKRHEYLDILQSLWLLDSKSFASNYAPETLLSYAFQPFPNYNSGDTLQIGVDRAYSWLKSRDSNQNPLAVKAFQTLLATFWEYMGSESDDYSLRTIPIGTEIFRIREQALDLILEAIQEKEHCLDCLRIMDKIGEGDRFHTHEDLLHLPAFSRIQQEIERCIPAIGAALCESQDFLVQKTAESTLFKWWLWDVSDKMQPWLLQFDRTPEYRLYRYALEWRTNEDLKDIIIAAPRENRWHWYWEQNNQRERRQFERAERHEKLANDLNAIYKTPEEIASFIHDSAEKLAVWEAAEQTGRNFMAPFNRIMEDWVLLAPEKFKKLSSDPELSTKLPESTKIEIGKKLLELGPTNIVEAVEAFLNRLPFLTYLECNQLVVFIQTHNPRHKEEWLTQMVAEGNEELLFQIADRLCIFFSPKTEAQKIAKYLYLICSSGRITRELFFSGGSYDARNAYRAIINHIDQIPAETDENLRKATFDLVKKMSRLDFSVVDTLQYCVRDINHLIELFDYRVSHFSRKNYSIRSDFVVEDALFGGCFLPVELPGIFGNFENHRKFVDRISDWEHAVGAYSSDWRNSYLFIKDPETNVLWLLHHLENAIEEKDDEAIERYCRYMPREDQYLPIMLKAWRQLSDPTQNADLLENLIWSWIMNTASSPGWIGSENNYHKRSKEILSWMLKQPDLGLRLRPLISRISADIEEQEQRMRADD